MRLSILGFIRPEIKFDSLDELKTQIKSDIEITKSMLAKISETTQQKTAHILNTNNLNDYNSMNSNGMKIDWDLKTAKDTFYGYLNE